MKNAVGRIDILLMEDDPSDAKLVLNTLKKANIFNKTHVLSDGALAIDFILRKGSFSEQPPLSSEVLILLSLNLGTPSGLDVLRKLKADERTRSLPVIILTSSQEGRGVMQGYKLGASACIVKPVDLRKLIEAIAELRLGWLLISPEENHDKA